MKLKIVAIVIFTILFLSVACQRSEETKSTKSIKEYIVIDYQRKDTLVVGYYDGNESVDWVFKYTNENGSIIRLYDNFKIITRTREQKIVKEYNGNKY